MPPPYEVEYSVLPFRMQPVMVSVQLESARMPPPLSPLPFSSVRFLSVSVLSLATENMRFLPSASSISEALPVFPCIVRFLSMRISPLLLLPLSSVAFILFAMMMVSPSRTALTTSLRFFHARDLLPSTKRARFPSSVTAQKYLLLPLTSVVTSNLPCSVPRAPPVSTCVALS